MSPRAACRLEALGFENVYDYELGKADWKAAGLPLEGTAVAYQTVADATRPDVPTCSPDELIGEVRERVLATGWSDCIVVDCEGLVVGRLRQAAWDLDDSTVVIDAMQSGPTTVRPDGLLDALVQRMDRRPMPLVVVTTPQGRLVGVVLREEAKRLLAGEPPEMVWAECAGCPGQWRPNHAT